MTLLDALREHLTKGQQGQLVIKFAGEVHLCKILVEDGKAVHIAHGRLAPEAIIDTLTSKNIEWTKFIAGYPVRKRVDFPLHENLLAVADRQSTVQAAQPAPGTVAAPPQAEPVAPVSGPTIEADKVAAAIEGFIELIGPLGTILAEQAASALNHTSGTPMPESSYSRFVLELGKEVPDADRNAFIDQYQL